MRKLTERDIQDVTGQGVEGYRIESARVKSGPFTDSDHYGFILARNACGSYVTWQFHLLEDGAVSAYWGHYFGNDRDAAVRDFGTRSIQ